MADNTHEHEEDRELGPTYRTLFIGACLLISGAFGWWFTNFISSVERFQREHDAALRILDKTCSTLAAGDERATWERDALKRELADLRQHIEQLSRPRH